MFSLIIVSFSDCDLALTHNVRSQMKAQTIFYFHPNYKMCTWSRTNALVRQSTRMVKTFCMQHSQYPHAFLCYQYYNLLHNFRFDFSRDQVRWLHWWIFRYRWSLSIEPLLMKFVFVLKSISTAFVWNKINKRIANRYPSRSSQASKATDRLNRSEFYQALDEVQWNWAYLNICLHSISMPCERCRAHLC